MPRRGAGVVAALSKNIPYLEGLAVDFASANPIFVPNRLDYIMARIQNERSAVHNHENSGQ